MKKEEIEKLNKDHKEKLAEKKKKHKEKIKQLESIHESSKASLVNNHATLNTFLSLFKSCGADKECLNECQTLVFSGRSVVFPEGHKFSLKFTGLLENALRSNAISEVKHLKLYRTYIRENNGIRSIMSALKTNSTLKVLDLGYTDATNEDVRDIANMLRSNQTLEELNLSETYIDDAGANELFAALKEKTTITLKKLILPSSGVFASGVSENKKQEMRKALKIIIE